MYILWSVFAVSSAVTTCFDFSCLVKSLASLWSFFLKIESDEYWIFLISWYQSVKLSVIKIIVFLSFFFSVFFFGKSCFYVILLHKFYNGGSSFLLFCFSFLILWLRSILISVKPFKVPWWHIQHEYCS